MRFVGATVARFLVLSGCSGSDADDAAAKKDEAVDRGRAWCAKLTDPETTREDVTRALAELLRESSSTGAAQQATTFYSTAAKAYCPVAAGRLQ